MNRQAVPEAVKRQLRQEAGFGCCNCGHPFIQYHHIVPYAEEKHMRPEDMMVVCGNCHTLLTNSAVCISEQRKWKIRPHNVVENLSKGRLYITSSKLKVRFAGGVAVNTPTLLSCGNDEPILRLEQSDDGRVLASAVIQNNEGEVIARLFRNEWLAAPSEVWDFEVYPKRAIVRSGSRKISFGIDCREDEVRTQGEWFLGGQRVQFSPSTCLVGGVTLNGFHVENCGTFINIH